jgi:hypothetical protein
MSRSYLYEKEYFMAEHDEFLPKGEDNPADGGDNFTSQLVTEGENLEIPTKETAVVKSALTAFKTARQTDGL